MATPRDLIKRSLKIIGVLGAGEVPSAEDVVDGLSSLNGMLAVWSNRRTLLHARTREEFDLTPGQASYTFGPGADFNSSRPLEINSLAILENDLEIPIEGPLTVEEWAMINVKTTQSTLPTKAYLEGTYPNETVKLWPVPSETKKLVVYSQKPLGRFANSNVTVELPEGYEEAIVFNLAKRLAPEYGKQLTAESVQIADQALDLIMATNLEVPLMESDAPGVGSGSSTPHGFSIFTGK